MAYQLRLGDRKYSRRFHTNSVYLNVDFTQNWNNVLPAEVPQQLDNTFNQIIRDIGNYLSCDPDDQVRFSVSHPGLKSPAWIPFNKWSGIRAQDILNPVARILQSNEQFRLDERMTLHVCHVSVPKGDGQGRYLLKRESLSLEDYLKRKKAIVVVKNKDNLCFQRAIVIAKHYANKNDTPEWETQRKRLTKSSGPYSWQTKCTERLIEQRGHWASNCQEPKRKQPRKGKCYQCKQEGHWKSECPQKKIIDNQGENSEETQVNKGSTSEDNLHRHAAEDNLNNHSTEDNHNKRPSEENHCDFFDSYGCPPELYGKDFADFAQRQGPVRHNLCVVIIAYFTCVIDSTYPHQKPCRCLNRI
ncbi:hypothetical protein LOTGIDRAFT_153473 [Lottia gigantea]|uniref:CCHC-type domain-containing protein n=1 Tax=Lottia gigantea TaxID=225164 RepID=V4AFT2_LOTGI|nr:hypothetical protein LOTGIDRAFT_153473 [Lottia gigantea]ESO93995.1 hypothetical protein LOTGIDRAFT_153473 [Lottia gigantea]